MAVSFLLPVYFQIKNKNICIEAHTGGSSFGKPVHANDCVYLGTSQVHLNTSNHNDRT